MSLQQGQNYRIDSGFIVHNPRSPPAALTRLSSQLGVQSQPTTMSFSVHNEASGLEYNAATLDTLFCQRRNLCSPRFIGMVRDLTRFYREAPELLGQHGTKVLRWAIICCNTDTAQPSRDVKHLGADGFGTVVIACSTNSALPRPLSGAVHGQPSDAADR